MLALVVLTVNAVDGKGRTCAGANFTAGGEADCRARG
jgi:hypothetical protein